ncbi:MAG: NUDIX domain-containing protein [Oscillospiraceae bacterium]|nr:NUDIX domain-containing protein [Oscillospiraceae bacterium]
MGELWDMLDSNGDRTGRVIERGQAMFRGEFHLAVHVWIRNGKGEWLISKRSPEKETLPNIWVTCGGAAVAGEGSMAAALREAGEELGIALDPGKGRLFSTIILENRHPPGGSCMTDVWVFSHDCPIEDIVLQLSETCDARWENADTISAMIASGEFSGETNFDEIRLL